MDKILYTKFKNIDDIIQYLAKDSVLKKALTRSNLCKFWRQVAGEKFASNSKPYSMVKGHIMVIACKTSIVAQELLLRKTQLLTKFQPYAKSLKMTVTDLRFDAKKWVDED